MPKPGAGMPPALSAILAGVPSTTAILDEVIQILALNQLGKENLSRDLDNILDKMMTEGLRALRRHQADVTERLVTKFLDVKATDPEGALTLIEKGFTSMGNQRKKRAGVHLEKCAKWILDRCGVPNEEAAAISGQSDLVVPSAKVLHERSERAVVLEFKRTIRERWKEVRDEIARTGLKVWLITLDDYISDDNVKLMAAGNITLYVPETVYQRLAKQKQKGQLRSLKSLVDDLEAFVGATRQ